ncbi:MAG: hypothetical protein N2440_02875 [Actinobacteria bacterium]|nr:hypothetical protein [Actinomycetota bacterium]
MAKIKVYLSDNTKENEEAFEIISLIKTLVPNAEVSVCNIQELEVPELIKGTDGPIYEISGFLFKGNPSPQQLREILMLIASKYVN